MERTALEVANEFVRSLPRNSRARLEIEQSLLPYISLRARVRIFHVINGVPIRHAPMLKLSDVSDEEIALRINLVIEEFREWLSAFGFDSQIAIHANPEHIRVNECLPCDVALIRDRINVSEIADASGDLKYVLEGSDIQFGIPSEVVFREIHASNMTKLHVDGKPIYREDGKILKGPNYVPPNIKGILFPNESNEEGEE